MKKSMRELHRIEILLINTLVTDYGLTLVDIYPLADSVVFLFDLGVPEIQDKILSMSRSEYRAYRHAVRDYPDEKENYKYWTETHLDSEMPPTWAIDEYFPRIGVSVTNPEDINTAEFLGNIEDYVTELRENILAISDDYGY